MAAWCVHCSSYGAVRPVRGVGYVRRRTCGTGRSGARVRRDTCTRCSSCGAVQPTRGYGAVRSYGSWTCVQRDVVRHRRAQAWSGRVGVVRTTQFGQCKAFGARSAESAARCGRCDAVGTERAARSVRRGEWVQYGWCGAMRHSQCGAWGLGTRGADSAARGGRSGAVRHGRSVGVGACGAGRCGDAYSGARAYVQFVLRSSAGARRTAHEVCNGGCSVERRVAVRRDAVSGACGGCGEVRLAWGACVGAWGLGQGLGVAGRQIRSRPDSLAR